MFGGRAIASLNPQWRIVDVPGFESDHRVTQTILNFQPNRVVDTPLDWKKVDKKRLQTAVQDALEGLDTTISLTTCLEIDKYAADMTDRINGAISATVPVTKPRTPSPDLRTVPEVKVAFDEAWIFLQEARSRRRKSRRYDTRYSVLVSKAQHLLRQAKRKAWREFTSTNDPRIAYRLARIGKHMCSPTPVPCLDRSVIDNKTYDTTRQMSHIFRDHLWPDTHDHIATPIPEPPTATARREPYPYPQELGRGELGQLIDKLKVPKAADRDRVTNELLKLTKDIILPYLEHLFRACIALSHLPDRFKIAMTIMLRKPRKETYIVPESWRPIALLSSIGKLLERLIANRLRDLCVKYHLLPATQFGVAGKCTTKAMRYILDPVYSAWCMNLQATLLSLDIKGAFDRVGRKRLLDILAERGIPYWIIKIVWSFLSDRRTTLDMPGHPSQGLFFVNVGIPQGSPLSPILFSLFAAPLLDRLAQYTGSKTKFALAYVDDTYLLVVSRSHRYNCRLLRQLHDVVMA